MFVQFKPGSKHAGKDAEFSESLDAFTDAGYVIEEDDLIVDIDKMSKDQIKAMIESFDIKTQITWTDRGAHLYFKKPLGFRRAKSLTPLGVEVEYKKITDHYITVKRGGVARVTENQGAREDLPYILQPGNKYRNLLGLQEGDGRNQELFAQRCRLGNAPQLRKIVKFINEHIFDEPLPEKEVESICRDIDMNDQGEKPREIIVAEQIMKDHKVVRFNNQLFYYDGLRYQDDDQQLDQLICKYCPNDKTSFMEEVEAQMLRRATLIPKNETFSIKLRNGFLDCGKFYRGDYEGFTPYFIDIPYNPDAKPVEIVDKYLDQLTDQDEGYRELVLEMIGHCLITDPEFKRHIGKFFVAVGSGGNGKGTLLAVIRAILNSENCSSMSISEMTDRTYLASMNLKLANLGDDIEGSAINDKEMKALKNVSTCDVVEVRRLYKDPISCTLTATLIFTTNHIIKSFEKSDAYKRRVIWMPMFNKIRPEDKDSKFISKLTSDDALEYWMKLIVEAYEKLYERGEFEIPQIVEEWNEEYHRENDSTIEFVESLTKGELDKVMTEDIYHKYEAWCDDNGEKKLSRAKMKESVKKIHGLDSKHFKVNGRSLVLYYDASKS